MALVTALLAVLGATAWAGPAAPSEALRGAEASLDSCEIAQAPYWAARLDPVSTELALLYRLSWLERAGTPSRPHLSRSDESSLAWKWDGEVWADQPPPSRGRCKGGEPAKLSEIKRNVATPLLDRLARSYSRLSAESRKLVRSYLYYRWVNGSPPPRTELPELSSALDRDEECELRSLRRMVVEESDGGLGKFLQSCPLTDISAAARTLVADQLLAAAEPEAAYAIYRGVYEKGDRSRDVPDAFWYRLGVSGALSGKSDDGVLRALTHAMNSSLEPIHRSVARNLACELLGQLGPAEGLTALGQVYAQEALASHVVSLAQTCDSEAVAGVAKRLADRSTSPRERIALRGVVLSRSLHHRRWEQARGDARLLSDESRKYPALSGHAFWASLTDGPRARETATVIQAYRSRARWLPVDDERQKRWRSSLNEADAQPAGYLADSISSQASVTVPVGLLPPQVKWSLPEVSGFFATFRSAAHAALNAEAMP